MNWYWSFRRRIWSWRLDRMASKPGWQHKILVLPPDRGEK